MTINKEVGTHSNKDGTVDIITRKQNLKIDIFNCGFCGFIEEITSPTDLSVLDYAEDELGWEISDPYFQKYVVGRCPKCSKEFWKSLEGIIGPIDSDD